ncbi:MAG: tRNA (adenosine(37)-N6)-dimethylallyltransferase MiaA [Chitinivibrionia bacterium]|nr:tRNA (adenosine(37)-N6)-dimethylallyltransferase MiaA [Chitinivibrionia bacterium]
MPEHKAHKRSYFCIAIMGATATGKSAFAIELAGRICGEVVSMDSRQVYRGMDIGTAKVGLAEQQGIRHHLIDIMNPDEANSAGKHARLAREAIGEIEARGRIPILAGGTGLYFRALFKGLADVGVDEGALREIRESFAGKSTDELFADLQRFDPARARKLSRGDRMRITRALEVRILTGRTISEHFSNQTVGQEIDAIKLVLGMPRVDLRGRIARRTREMFGAGWIEEVRSLLAAGYNSLSPGLNSLGYKQISLALESGRNPCDDMDAIITLTRQYAKRQETFFRREEDALWLDVTGEGFKREAYARLSSRTRFKNNLT